MSASRTLVIAGGGTGGHLMPALALAEAVRARWPEVAVEFIGAQAGLEARLLPARNEQVLLLPMHGVKGSGAARTLRVLAWELPRAVARVLRAFARIRPALVVGFGGYASVAAVLAALLARVPVVLHEQNAQPGLVNRRLSGWVRLVMLGFAEARARLPRRARTVVTGNPVRAEIARVRWGAHEPPCLAVIGGSQGARTLNETVPQACARLSGRSFSVVHVAGGREGEREAVERAYRETGIEAEVLGFCDDMAGLYRRASLVVARAGAMTVAELATVGMPAILVPYPYAADDHQRHNARVLADRGAAEILDEADLTAERLADRLRALLFDAAHLEAMSRAARSAMPEDAGARMLDALAPWLAPAQGGRA